jgi:dGTP triphosphohydrolase
MRVEQKVTRMDFAMKALKQENVDAQSYLGKLTDWLSTVRDNAATKEFRQTILDKIKGVEDQIAERVKRVEDMKENIREINSKLREEAQKAAEAEEAKVKAKAAEAELAAQKALEKEQALAQKAIEKEQAAAKKAAELIARNNKKEAASVSENASNKLATAPAEAIVSPVVEESVVNNSETSIVADLTNVADVNNESSEVNTSLGEATAENVVPE